MAYIHFIGDGDSEPMRVNESVEAVAGMWRAAVERGRDRSFTAPRPLHLKTSYEVDGHLVTKSVYVNPAAIAMVT